MKESGFVINVVGLVLMIVGVLLEDKVKGTSVFRLGLGTVLATISARVFWG